MKKIFFMVLSAVVVSNLNANNTIVIRKAVYEDKDEIARVHYASWHDTYKDVNASALIEQHTLPWFLEYWRRHITAPEKACLLVATLEGKIVGFASAGPVKNKLHFTVGHDGELYKLYLLPDWRGRGIGKQLFAACVQQLQVHGFKTMLIQSIRENKKASRFYEKEGARVLGEQACLVDATVTEIFYSFKLS
jgi:ribosomal protein S18 acetylase RimI-like enzyme